MQTFIAVTPEEEQDAARLRRPLAHVAYRIGPSSSLLRRNLLLQTRGGLLSVSDRDSPAVDDPGALCAAVLRECGRRDYQGVLLDFEASPRPDLLDLVRRLGERLPAARRTLYVPEGYASAAPTAPVLVNAAVSGGSWEEYLREQIRRLGPGRLALDLERVRMDFSLPAPSGQGTPLSGQELARLLEQARPAVFFSPELCARYFTCIQDGETHFILFDDAGTLRRKLRTAAALGCAAAFLMWPEIRDAAGELFQP